MVGWIVKISDGMVKMHPNSQGYMSYLLTLGEARALARQLLDAVKEARYEEASPLVEEVA